MPQPGVNKDLHGRLDELAGRLARVQRTTRPRTKPRRLLLFVSDRPTLSRQVLAGQVEAILAGTATNAILAKTNDTHLAIVDLGVHASPRPDADNYRCRRVQRSVVSGSASQPLSLAEFQAALLVGRQEADRASRDGMSILAAAELECSHPHLERLVERIAQLEGADADCLASLTQFGLSIEVAAMAGAFARAAELGIGILVDGPASVAGAIIASVLFPGTRTSLIAATQAATTGEEVALQALQLSSLLENWSLPDRGGVGVLLALPLLDAAAEIAAQGEREPMRDSASSALLGGRDVRRVAVFTGSFDPPTTYHRRVAQLVCERGFQEVIVRPTGPRPERPDGEHAAPIHRAVMVDLAFHDLPGVSVDLADLDEGAALDDRVFDSLYADRGEVWHIVSADFLIGGREGTSDIQTRWLNGAELWKSGRFVVLHPTASPPEPEDLPPVHELVAVDGHVPTADIRIRVFLGDDPNADVPERVAAYIRRYRLFSDFPAPRETRIVLTEPRFLIVANEANAAAQSCRDRLNHLESEEPHAILVLGGDGTMLEAIRQHWRKRLPFIGLNVGHLGFLMNERLPEVLNGLELVVYRMPMLRVDLVGPDGSTSRSLAFADAWLERNTGQAAWLRVDVDGRVQVPRVVGDGLLIATASGSSAYARAMGATPVPLTAPVLTLAGSNVFRPRFWKPVALPESAIVRLTNIGETGKRSVRGFLDGHPLGLVTAMEVRVSSIAAVELAFTPQFDLSDRLLRSMFPPHEEL